LQIFLDINIALPGTSRKPLQINPLKPTVAIWHSATQGWASECPDVKNYKWLLNTGCIIIDIAVPIWQQWASKG